MLDEVPRCYIERVNESAQNFNDSRNIHNILKSIKIIGQNKISRENKINLINFVNQSNMEEFLGDFESKNMNYVLDKISTLNSLEKLKIRDD